MASCLAENSEAHNIMSCCLLQPLGKGLLLCVKFCPVVPVREGEVSRFSAADPEKRKVYDAYGEEGLKAGATPPVSTLACACTCTSHLLSYTAAAMLLQMQQSGSCRSVVSLEEQLQKPAAGSLQRI